MIQLAVNSDYAGDISPLECWQWLTQEPNAVLIDVRTRAEWGFVGVPDVAAAGKKLLMIEWQQFPSMAINPHFVDDLLAQLALPGVRQGEGQLMFLCRSGARSAAAAATATKSGLAPSFNVAGGFEGDLDSSRQRSRVNGWKALGLPWVQS